MRVPISCLLSLFTWPALLGVACGPSVQSIHEGNVRFEHCYRLDMDRSITASHRQMCWRDWVDRYTYGQAGDRIQYARRRIDGIASGVTNVELDLDAGSLADGGATASSPISVHGPPPALAPAARPAPNQDAGASVDGGGPADGGSDARGPELPPSTECETSCRDAFQDCTRACAQSADSGTPESKNTEPARKAGCQKCQLDYRSCMRRCFR